MDAERGFDFWLGTWDCSWDGGHGRNVVDRICDGRVVRERFDAAAHGLVGTSISVYDAAAAHWVQTWMDSDGSWFHLTGGTRERAMELLTTSPDGDGYRKRMRFADITPASFRWTWARSRGGDWEDLWEIDYLRSG
jgi:hypothetical protein